VVSLVAGSRVTLLFNWTAVETFLYLGEEHEAIGYLNPGDAMPYESLGGADRRHRFTLSAI